MSTLAGVPASPYKGLTPFGDSELDALLFFGRERDGEIVVANLIAARLTVLYGPSGVGKSSMLRAGVARALRELPEEPLVVVFSSWGEDPLGALIAAVAEEAGIEPAATLLETVERAQAVHGDIYLILDQAEEYFLYHAGEGRFEPEFARLVTEPLRVNVLLSLREDALAQLDRFKARIPNILGNYLRLDRLDRAAGRDAILRPVERYRALGGAAIDVEPGLVDVVLDQVTVGRIGYALGGLGGVEAGVGGNGKPAGIEAPFLQLVMQRVWEIERTAGSDELRAETLDALGGAQTVVADHLERAMAALAPRQQEIAAQLFNHLVTPSGTKIAHGVADLAEYARVPEAEVRPVVASLAEHRILRPDESGRYEIFHDVLAAAVLGWRTRYEADRAVERARAEARRRHRRLGFLAFGALVALALMAAVTVYALDQRSAAQSEAEAAQQAQERADRLALVAIKERNAAEKQATVAKNAQAEAVKQAKLAEQNEAKAEQQETIAQQQADAAEAAQEEAQTQAANAQQQSDNAAAQTANAQQQRDRANTEAAAARAARAFAQKQANRARASEQDAKRQAGRARTASEKATTQARLAHGRELVAQAVSGLAIDPDASVASALQAVGIDPSPEAESALRNALLASRARGVLDGGGGPVVGAAFTGGAMVTAAENGATRIFDGSGRLSRELSGPATLADGTSRITAMAVDPVGHVIATATADGSITLRDLAGGRRPRSLDHGSSVTALTFSPNGRLLVSTGTNQSARIWDVAGSTRLLKRIPHPRSVRDVSFSPDGTTILTVAGDHLARLFEVRSGDLVHTFEQAGAVTSAAISPRGDRIVTTGRDTVPRLWDAATGALLHELAGHRGEVFDAAFSPDGTLVATASADNTGRVWGVESGGLQTVLFGHTNFVDAIAFSPDGTLIATASRDHSARIWDAFSGNPDVALLGHRGAVTSVQFDESGRRAITASVDGTARVWDPQSDPELAFLGRHDGSVNDVAVDSTGALVASAGEDGRARLWNLHRSPGPVFEGGAPLSALAFAPEDLLVAARKDGVVRVWSLRTRATVRSLDHGSPVHDVAVSLDGTIATAGEDGIVRLWNADGKPGLQIRHDAPVAAVAFSPDGSLLATASGTVVRLWSVSDGHRTKELRAHTNDVLSVAFDAGGKLLVTASVDRDARVWDLARATTVKTFSGHAGEVTDAAFSPDGSWVVTAGPSRAGVWGLALRGRPGDRLVFLRGHTRPLTAVAFAPGSRRIVTGSADGTVRTYVCRLCGDRGELVTMGKQRLRALVPGPLAECTAAPRWDRR